MRDRELATLIEGPCDGLPLPETAHLVSSSFAVRIPGARPETHRSPFAMYVWRQIEAEEDGLVWAACWAGAEWLDIAGQPR